MLPTFSSDAPQLSHPGKEATVAQDHNDLLMGLGSDDLNDFDGLDEFSTGIRNEEGEEDPFLQPVPYLITSSTGFSTGAGRTLPRPSSAAYDKAWRLLNDVDILPDADADNQASGVDNEDLDWKEGDKKRRRIQGMHRDNETSAIFASAMSIPATPLGRRAVTSSPEQTSASEASLRGKQASLRSSPFTTGNGNAIAGPSSSARAAVDALFGINSDADQGLHDERTNPNHAGSATWGGKTLATSGQTSVSRVSSLFASDEAMYPKSLAAEEAAQDFVGFNDPSDSRSTINTSFTTGGGRPVPGPSAESLRRVSVLFVEDEDPNRNFNDSAHLPEVPGPPSSSFLKPTPKRGETTLATPVGSTAERHRSPRAISPNPAYRTPLRTTTNVFGNHRVDGTPKIAQPPVTPIFIKAPSTGGMRRIGLGSTQVARTQALKGFVTPFKKLSGSPLRRPSTPRTSLLPHSHILREAHTAKASPPVFDLVQPAYRQTMKAAFLHPGYYDLAELREMGFPDELWSIGLDNAVYYQFIAEDGTTLGAAQALEILKREGCELATQKWVDNHYSQILWKLAGQVRAKPSLWGSKWNWAEVLSQIKYRFEREISQAQRPIVRRIQEHDSSPSLPLVLCVCAIRHPPPQTNDKGIAIPIKPYLELTDGWYKIIAEIDDCMHRAVEKGKIVVGRKLAISGAKLESAGDGAEVLAAFDKSRLVLSGNSCSLARWHARLGHQSVPFIAGLSSLSIDGGIIMLLDIRIEKVYPSAFMPADRTLREPPWNEDEEQMRADRWKETYIAESTRLQENMRKQLEKIEDLVGRICGAAQEMQDVVDATPPETLESDFDMLLAPTDTSLRLRDFSDAHIVHLARYGQTRMERELQEGQVEVEAELQVVCPAREVRNFRMIRISDARNIRKDKMRMAMVNVWDARSLGDGVLQEGRRYMVTNLIPARNGDWRLPKAGELHEIYLHTRRDTRWQLLEV